MPGEGEATPDDEARRVWSLLAAMRHDGPRPDLGWEPGPIERLFWEGRGPNVHKWHHVLPLYDRYLAPWRGRPLRFLEIGVFHGGSLWLWREVFGPEATIFGIDIDPACAAQDGRHGQVRIGSQADPAFLAAVVEEMGGVDVVLDDGSHDSRHIRASLAALFPRLADGGLYMVEDLHAAYWPSFSGGYGAPSSFMSDVKAMIDDLHHWYHEEGQRIDATRDHLRAIHVHDSFVALEKGRPLPPRHTVREGPFERPAGRRNRKA